MGAAFSCYGVTIGVRSTSADGFADLAQCAPRAFRRTQADRVTVLYSFVPGGEGPRRGTKTFHLLYRNSSVIGRSLRLDDVRAAFVGDVGLRIGDLSPSHVFIHAGVVGFGDGVVLIPGKSRAGKTSLVRALVERGGTYFSDEFAVVDSRGRVFPWAEPLAIRPPGARKGVPHAAAALGFRSGTRALPVRMVLLTSFEPGRRFRPRAQSAATGMLHVLSHTLCAQRDPRRTLNVIGRALAGAAVYQGVRGEASLAARTVVGMLGRGERLR
jgi:hypothetical protein